MQSENRWFLICMVGSVSGRFHEVVTQTSRFCCKKPTRNANPARATVAVPRIPSVEEMIVEAQPARSRYERPQLVSVHAVVGIVYVERVRLVEVEQPAKLKLPLEQP